MKWNSHFNISSHLWNCRSHCVVALCTNRLFICSLLFWLWKSVTSANFRRQYSVPFALQSKCVQFIESTVIDLDKDLVYVVYCWQCSRRIYNWRHHSVISSVLRDEQTVAATIHLNVLWTAYYFAVAHSTILFFHCLRKGVRIHICTMFMAALKTIQVFTTTCGMVGHVETIIT